MGKTRRHNTTKDQVKTLMANAQDQLAKDNVEEGLAKMREACALAPDDASVVDSLGCALAEHGCGEEAVRVLRRAVELSPSSGFEKYMYLGQLLDSEQAILSVRAGIKVLQHEAATDPELAPHLTSAMCSLLELLLNSQQLAEVEVECEALVKEAMRADPTSPEPMQAMASLRNEQGRDKEALKALRASIKMWLPATTAGPAVGHGEDEIMGDDLPSFEFRFEAAKLSLDLEETTDTAIRILNALLMENDSCVDVWYLLGLAHHGACQFEDAMECIDNGVEILNKQFSNNPAEVEGKLAEFAELKAAVEDSAKAMGDDVCGDADASMEEG